MNQSTVDNAQAASLVEDCRVNSLYVDYDSSIPPYCEVCQSEVADQWVRYSLRTNTGHRLSVSLDSCSACTVKEEDFDDDDYKLPEDFAKRLLRALNQRLRSYSYLIPRLGLDAWGETFWSIYVREKANPLSKENYELASES